MGRRNDCGHSFGRQGVRFHLHLNDLQVRSREPEGFPLLARKHREIRSHWG